MDAAKEIKSMQRMQREGSERKWRERKWQIWKSVSEDHRQKKPAYMTRKQLSKEKYESIFSSLSLKKKKQKKRICRRIAKFLRYPKQTSMSMFI